MSLLTAYSLFLLTDDDFLLSSLGFDHCHPEVYEHCKRLLLHLLIVMGPNSNIQTVASVLLRNKEFNEARVLTVKHTANSDYTFTGIYSKLQF
jgi:hypothetical protein